MSCYTYLILCNNGNLYCGMTNDFQNRWKQHKLGIGARYIRIHGFNKPVYLEKLKDKPEARRREIEIKKLSKKEKIELLDSPKNIINSISFSL